MALKLPSEIDRARREIRRLKNSLRAEELRAKVFSEYNSFGLWEYDIASGSLRQFKKLYGDYESGGETVKNFRGAVVQKGSIFAEDLPEFNRFCDAMQRGDSEVSCEIRVIGKDFKIEWRRFEGKAVLGEKGQPLKIVGRTVDITREKSGSGLSGKHDPLTGVCSAELFSEIVRQKRRGVNRYTGGALLSIGVDRFPDIAANQGKEYADYVQKTVADILTDISSARSDGVTARVRDGEFLMYLSFNGTGIPDKIAKLIIDKVNAYPFDGEAVGVSVGISRLKHGRKLDDVYAEAFLAMSEARKSGGRCYMRYSQSMSLAALDMAADAVSPAAGGEAKIYELIVRAFCGGTERSALMKSAFKALGQFSGASSVCFFRLADGKARRYIAFNSLGGHGDECPCVALNSSLSELFADGDCVRVFDADGERHALTLQNGAVCAECRAIRSGGKIVAFFAVVFGGSFVLSNEVLRAVDAISDALSVMYSAKAGRYYKRFSSAIISDHRMEGFSIVPESFTVDYVGENAAEHYNLKPGDVCYKKMRGRGEPCSNCPALKLRTGDSMSASTAYYEEDSGRWLDITASVNENEFGERRYIISTTDITDCLGKIRMTDTLTGAMTFDTFAAEAMRLTSADGGGYYIAVINVASFRRINETHGFEAGNRILVTVAETLLHCLGEGEAVCRTEGSRFVALLKEADEKALEDRLKLILNSVQQQVFDRSKIQIYLLAGLCGMSGEEGVGVMGALDRAITAQHTTREMLYFKDNAVVFYDGALRETIQERLYIENNMVGALENGEFRVYYQPKVSIATGEIVGAEALVRWIRPDGEMISPGRFVPIFEQNGFITEMDFAIYKNAVEDIAKWLKLGIEVPLISLNVSRFHLGDENFCEKLNSLVDTSGVPHGRVELEITESLLTENLEKLIETVTRFKEMGFKISVDDFGSGYSSLNLITQLPFDTLKIDGGFFLRKDLTDKNKKVISSVVTLAKSLNLETVSEGVETQVQVDFLRDLGCDMIQGFFYYKPMPGEEFEQLLISQGEKKPLDSAI